MARFCPYCGSQIRVEAKFCHVCGHLLPVFKPPVKAGQPAPKVQSPTPRQRTTQPVQKKPPHVLTAPVETTPVNNAVQRPVKLVEQMTGRSALSFPGEVDFGEIGMQGIASEAAKVFSPIAGIFHDLGSYLGGALKIITKPGALIGTILLAGMWFALDYFKDSGSELVKILSWLTYSEGGYGRPIAGMVGGILGKGTVAAAILSVFNGGIGRTFKGLAALFTGKGQKRGILGILLGIVIGAAAYLFFAGTGASKETAMAGIAGTLLAMQAMGGESGKLYDLAKSLTSRKTDGFRSEVKGKCLGLLTGITLGFAIATVLTAFGVLEGLL